MKYYVTQMWPGIVDLWSSEDNVMAQHIKRLYERIPVGGKPLRSRSLHSLNPYLFDESEDMDELIGSTVLRFM